MEELREAEKKVVKLLVNVKDKVRPGKCSCAFLSGREAVFRGASHLAWVGAH